MKKKDAENLERACRYAANAQHYLARVSRERDHVGLLEDAASHLIQAIKSIRDASPSEDESD